MKIIFLDIDGVLNCENAYKAGHCKYADLVGNRKYQTFYQPSKDWLNKLIDSTGAKIVITSTWRHSGMDYLKQVWEKEKMHGEIFDMTESLVYINNYGAAPRGLEINKWLNDKKFHHIFWSKEKQQKTIEESGIENYIIIDDDSDMLYNQKNNFVHVLPSPRNRDGFKEKHYNKAVEILSKSIINLHQDQYYV